MYFLLIIFILIHSSTSASYQCDRNSTCGCSSLSKVVLGRIVGGEQAQNNAWNWMISIQYKNIHMCGASLISSEFAVTAAHCFYDLVDDLNDWFIVSGTNYLKSKRSLNGQRRRILQLHFHPKYKAKYFNHDIALIRFAPLIIGSNSTSNIICLPDSKQDPFRTGTNLIALGWGDLYENSGKIQNALRQVTVKAVSTHSKDCRRAAIHNAQIKFCAGVRGGGKDTCQSDSGGPLMAFINRRWVLAGITSNGHGCAKPGYPGLYTRVSYFIPFINDIINGQNELNSIL